MKIVRMNNYENHDLGWEEEIEVAWDLTEPAAKKKAEQLNSQAEFFYYVVKPDDYIPFKGQR